MGISKAKGMIFANRLINKLQYVYVLTGDGELQEGQIWEAVMFAAHNKVDNLIATIDVNGQQIDGPLSKVLSLDSLEEKINADIKSAMLAKDAAKLEALRAVKSAILLLKTSPEGLNDDTEMKALLKMVKQRKETAELYVSQNRKDLADVELSQAAVIEAYLPQQMSEADVKAEVANIISSLGATSPADMGKVMGVASKQLAGKADGKLISTIVKELLSK